MTQTRKKRGGALPKFSKKVKEKVKEIPKEIEEVATKIPKKVASKGKKIMKKAVSEGKDIMEKVSDVAEGPLKKLEGPARKLLKGTEKIVSDMIPPIPTNKPFNVDVTTTTKNAYNAMTEVPAEIMKAPKIILGYGKRLGGNLVRRVEDLPGVNTIKKIPRRAYRTTKRGLTTVNRKTRKLLKRLPVGRVVKKVKEVPGDVKELAEKMSHPRELAKDVGDGIKNVGHKMVNSVRHGAKSIKHVATGLLPTFVWPVDGKCPSSQKGGRRTRRRRRKTRRYRKRRRKRRRTRKKRRRRRRRRTRRR